MKRAGPKIQKKKKKRKKEKKKKRRKKDAFSIIFPLIALIGDGSLLGNK